MLNMIYTDGKHLVSCCDDNELHKFAKTIGLKKNWFQNKNRHAHYDLFSEKKELAILKGATLITSKELVSILKKKSKQNLLEYYKD